MKIEKYICDICSKEIPKAESSLPIDADEFEISLVEFLCNFADLKDCCLYLVFLFVASAAFSII